MEIGGAILEVLNAWGTLLPRPFESKNGWSKRVRGISKSQFERSVRHMKNRGLIEVLNKNGQRFIKITRNGQLEALLSKATRGLSKQKWDGKWRLMIFDIPESSKEKRHIFRSLLRKNNFYKLQASVYISPYELNREAITYLNKSHLIDFIRILRVDEIDNDKFLKKHFNLK